MFRTGTPDDGQRNCPKHVEFYSKNKFEKLGHLVGFIIRIRGLCTQGNETLFPNWQKESWQTFEETSRYVRPERVNKWPNSMTDI